MNAAAQKKTGQRLHVAATQPAPRSKRRTRRPGILRGRPIWLEILFPRIRNLRTSHKLILIEKSQAIACSSGLATQDSTCPSSNTSAKNATTASKRWSTAKKKLRAPSATPRNLRRKSPCSRSPPKARPRPPRQPHPADADRVAIPAAPARAR